tara:strand:+ start:467 stop:796 length:330 start_codon:yes stop_codon:yes gene_type:complete
MSKVEEKATMTDSVVLKKNDEEQKPAPTFTYADYDAGTQKEWLVDALSPDAVLIINHVQNLQNKLTSLNLEAGDINSAILANKQKLTELLPNDDLAVITELEQQEATAH